MPEQKNSRLAEAQALARAFQRQGTEGVMVWLIGQMDLAARRGATEHLTSMLAAEIAAGAGNPGTVMVPAATALRIVGTLQRALSLIEGASGAPAAPPTPPGLGAEPVYGQAQMGAC